MVDPALPVDPTVGKPELSLVDGKNPALINLFFPDIVI